MPRNYVKVSTTDFKKINLSLLDFLGIYRNEQCLLRKKGADNCTLEELKYFDFVSDRIHQLEDLLESLNCNY